MHVRRNPLPNPPPETGEEIRTLPLPAGGRAGEGAYLNALPSAVIAIDRTLHVHFLNPAAEILLGTSAPHAVGKMLDTVPGFSPDLGELCERVFASGEAISLFEQALKLPFHHISVTMHLTPVFTDPPQLLITIESSGGIDRHAASEWKHEATRAAGVMAAMLAHEVKNPLSGIRGAAQLLREEVAPEHQALSDLICMETDRIRDLLDQVEVFSAHAPGERQPVNVHEVLRYATQVAQSGFARHVTFHENYDPSLPDVMARRDVLVQLLLNLIKNSAEALAGKENAMITLTTAYRSGYRIRGKSQLPVAVMIDDNGPGIPDDIRLHLFEPFVSSKEQGRGLGLAIVAKIASDLGAVAELDDDFDGGTRFIVCLPCS